MGKEGYELTSRIGGVHMVYVSASCPLHHCLLSLGFRTVYVLPMMGTYRYSIGQGIHRINQALEQHCNAPG